MTLRVFLLGQFGLEADGGLFELPSRPAQSLLAFLTLHPGTSYRREKLAGMLWPESEEDNARNYLRQALWRIRKSLQSGGFDWKDYLEINKISVCFKAESDYWLDVAELLRDNKKTSLEALEESLRCYAGELLPGFYDEWIGSEREYLQSTFHRKMNRLVEGLSERGQWSQVLAWSEQWVRHGHSPEGAFRAMMRAHAGIGDHAMVAATFERCLEAMDRELGLEPSDETTRLFEALSHPEAQYGSPPPPSSGLDDLSSFQENVLLRPAQDNRPMFVGRSAELGTLEMSLQRALSGHGQPIFVTGEAGSGKTSLLGEFARRALDQHADLLVSSGNCNAHTGVGDPYLPFREILGMLTGDVEARLEAGAITYEQAQRLMGNFPLAIQIMEQQGTSLIGTFVQRSALLRRVSSSTQDGEMRRRNFSSPDDHQVSMFALPAARQRDLHEQYSRVLHSLARRSPLVLMLDDLQWADAGSINMLFHLGRRLDGSRILIVGAYRKEEVALGRDGERHPLERVVNELQRKFGDISVAVGRSEGREFVDAILDSEPNMLGVEFRDKLHRQTLGHPLFTIELLRGMQDSGDLVQDSQGRWTEGAKLDWERMPARIEAVIGERIARLPPMLQSLLRAASVEGEVFTAEVVARAVQTDPTDVLDRLSDDLDRKHRLVRADSILRSDTQLLSRYRFRHILFQKYLYGTLDEVERVHLHHRIGEVIEDLLLDQPGSQGVAVQLARHFEESGILEKAIHYIYAAGDRAISVSGFDEGIAHLDHGLELILQMPPSPERDRLELKLQLSRALSWKLNWNSPKGRNAVERVRDLGLKLNETTPLSRVLGELTTYHYVQAEYAKAFEFASEALSLAEQVGDPILIAEGHWYLGILSFCLGDYLPATRHLEQVIDFYNPEQHHDPLVNLRGVDAGLSAMAYLACCLWCLGFPDQAQARADEALALAEAYAHPFTLADVRCYAGCMLNAMRRDPEALAKWATALADISEQVGISLSGWLGMGVSFQGEALVLMGNAQDGIARIRSGIQISEDTGVRLYRPIALRSLGEALGDIGAFEASLSTLSEAVASVEESGDRNWEAEIHRVLAEVSLASGDPASAQTEFEKAIAISRSQGAKSWQLRASIGLARLWAADSRKSGRGRKMLEDVCNSFSEGFQTPDYLEAKSQIDQLQ